MAGDEKKEQADRLDIENDLAGKTPQEIEDEVKVMADRAERVRRRLKTNSAIVNNTPPKTRK